jgi:prepilin-type N-terminal cleavage/methylation domain-containing protein
LKVKNNYKLQVTSYILPVEDGFTIIELLVVISIALIIAVASIPIYSNLQVSAQLNESTSQLIQNARIAQGKAVARVGSASHGVYFEINVGADDRYILYRGSSYAARDTDYDRTTTLDSAFTLSTTLSGNEVNFSKGFGLPDRTGTIVLTHDFKGIASVSINSVGLVEEE